MACTAAPQLALFHTAVGIEDLLVQELEELIPVVVQVRKVFSVFVCNEPTDYKIIVKPFDMDGWVGLHIGGLLDLAVLCYTIRIAHRAIFFLAKGTVRMDMAGGMQDITSILSEVPFEEWLATPRNTFAVRSHRKGQHEFRQPEVMRTAGDAVVERLERFWGGQQPVNIKNPDLTVRVDFFNSTCVCGIDFAGDAAAKEREALYHRGWRAYDHPAGLKSSLAAAMLRAVGFSISSVHESISSSGAVTVVVDPMVGGGTVPIEAAHIARGVSAAKFRLAKGLAFTKLPLRNFFPGKTEEELSSWQWSTFFEQVDRIVAEAAGAVSTLLRTVPPPPEGAKEAIVALPQPPALCIFGFDKFKKHVAGAKKNAESAGVSECVMIDKLDVAHLWVRLGTPNSPQQMESEQAVDRQPAHHCAIPPRTIFIVTNPPFGLRIADAREAKTVHEGLFASAQKLLAAPNRGRLVMLTVDRPMIVEEFAPRYGFEVEKEWSTWHGSLHVGMIVLKPANKS